MFGKGKNETLLTKPAKNKVLSFCQEIGKTVKAFNGKSQEQLINKLNPILRGWANYYRHCTSKKILSYVGNRVWKYLWDWARRRHKKRKLRWVKDKYFKVIYKKTPWSVSTRDWVFSSESTSKRRNSELRIYDVAGTPIVRHVN
ncbi:MAG: hypothetical protein F6K37_32375 [Moorea sp. SIO4E2]|uniref:group II intron maturase-specific domain-containing protein n=1 Tax=Moorena sp. SIO4E2 TaxID=2607826 RepID=UPI0013BC955A|nr:hypothetical protein [Moorena sp. SIO4E2]